MKTPRSKPSAGLPAAGFVKVMTVWLKTIQPTNAKASHAESRPGPVVGAIAPGRRAVARQRLRRRALAPPPALPVLPRPALRHRVDDAQDESRPSLAWILASRSARASAAPSRYASGSRA